MRPENKCGGTARCGARTRDDTLGGSLIELRAGAAAVAIDPARGSRLASLRVSGRELLVEPPDAADASVRWGSFLMAPWPGRLADGRLQFRGRSWQLPRTHGRHAIHGLVWSVPWTTLSSSDSSAELRVDLDGAGWPFGGEVRQAFRLEAGRLSMQASIVAGNVPMPAALGWHPWFRRDAFGGDASLRVQADGLLARHRMLPTGAVLPVAGRIDLRQGPVLGRRRLDDTYVGARSPAVLRGPEAELRIEFSPECDAVVAYTPWNAICVEPQTARPNALALPDEAARRAGRTDLVPHQALTAQMTIAWG